MTRGPNEGTKSDWKSDLVDYQTIIAAVAMAAAIAWGWYEKIATKPVVWLDYSRAPTSHENKLAAPGINRYRFHNPGPGTLSNVFLVIDVPNCWGADKPSPNVSLKTNAIAKFTHELSGGGDCRFLVSPYASSLEPGATIDATLECAMQVMPEVKASAQCSGNQRIEIGDEPSFMRPTGNLVWQAATFITILIGTSCHLFLKSRWNREREKEFEKVRQLAFDNGMLKAEEIKQQTRKDLIKDGSQESDRFEREVRDHRDTNVQRYHPGE